jgi:hypothetical protein
VPEWKQVPVEIFHHLRESVSRRVEAVIAAKGGGISLFMPMNEMFDEQVFTYFWPCSVHENDIAQKF